MNDFDKQLSRTGSVSSRTQFCGSSSVAGSLLALALLLGVVAVLTSGCQTPPSAADTARAASVRADITISAAREVFGTFDSWEKKNRMMLADSPEVRAYADVVREQSPGWLSQAESLRGLYETSPTPETTQRLRGSMDNLDAAIDTVSALMAENTSKVLPFLKQAQQTVPGTTDQRFSDPSSFIK